MEIEESLNNNYGPFITLFAVIFFGMSNIVLKNFIPQAVKTSSLNAWKWKNITNSFLHSTGTGCGALICFYVTPKLAEDVVNFHTKSSHYLISFSFGYFIYDAADMWTNNRTSRLTHELLIHHLAVASCYGIAMWTKRYVGFGIVSLLVEVNSIFLHVRQLLQLHGFSKSNKVFRLNSLVNLGTFVIFRIVTLAWMTRWLVINRDKVPGSVYALGSISVAIIVFMSIMLFFRLLNSDFIHNRIKEKGDYMPNGNCIYLSKKSEGKSKLEELKESFLDEFLKDD